MILKISLVLLLLSLGAAAQESTTQPPTAIDSLIAFREFIGRPKLKGLIEVIGTAGEPNPIAWRVILCDPASPTRVSSHVVRGPRVMPPEINETYYPRRNPSGYFSLADVAVDSVGAFRSADREAGKAMVGFDKIDYLLHCREFSDEPVWSLTLRLDSGAVVGTVSLSAKNGKILRTVWQRPMGPSKIHVEDSALPEELRPPPFLTPGPRPSLRFLPEKPEFETEIEPLPDEPRAVPPAPLPCTPEPEPPIIPD